jgi:hypothetical protein
VASSVASSIVGRRLPTPDWLGGLVFALVPLAISLLVLLPAMGAGVAGLGLVPLAGETLRYLLYGWALSTTSTLLSHARSHPGGPGRLGAPSRSTLRKAA